MHRSRVAIKIEVAIKIRNCNQAKEDASISSLARMKQKRLTTSLPCNTMGITFFQRRAEGTESGAAHDRRVEKSIAEKLMNKKSSTGARL